MLARSTRWRLVLGSNLLAEGDTVVAPLDSVTITRWREALVPAGSYDLRLVGDSLGVAHETNESNNASMRTLQVVEGQVAVAPVTGTLALSEAMPNPSRGKATFMLHLPQPARVEFSIYDLQGRRVWQASPRELSAGRWPLTWEGRSGRTGLYLAHIRVNDTTWVRRFALLR